MTVSLLKSSNFHNLSKEEAEKVLYETVLPACEQQGVLLLPEGNVQDRERYNEAKDKRTIFDIERVQKAFAAADLVYQPARTTREPSKPFYENHPAGGYVGGGELMAALILKGYPAKFGVDGQLPTNLRAEMPLRYKCEKYHHKSRLFIGEAHFKGVESLINKHAKTHPNLGYDIIATELETFGRTSIFCPNCQSEQAKLSEDDSLFLDMSNLFAQNVSEKKEIFCGDFCKRLQNLKNRGVNVLLGFDGTQIDRHPVTKGKRFQRIHWNCPHDKSSYQAQTLPPIIKDFFASAKKVQRQGDRIHITLAQPYDQWDKGPFYQGVVYNIRDAADANGYKLYAKRPFDSVRYPGYKHEQTGNSSSAQGASKLREFVFIQGPIPASRSPSFVGEKIFGGFKREYYLRSTDNESSSYSDED